MGKVKTDMVIIKQIDLWLAKRWSKEQTTLSTLDKIFSFYPENRIGHFMQIVSIADNLHELSNPVFWKKN